MRFKKIIAIMLLFAFVFQLSASALPEVKAGASEEQYFSDIKGHWAEKEILELASLEIIKGYLENGKRFISPDRSLTRAEYAQLIARARKLSMKSPIPVFDDVKSSDWFYDAVGMVSSNGIMIGSDGKFHPERFVTRAEMVTVTARLMGFEENVTEQYNNSFTDLSVSDWYYKYALFCVKKGLIKGYSDSTFRGFAEVTRAECFVVLLRLLKANPTPQEEPETPCGGGGGGGGTANPTLSSLSPSSGTLGSLITINGSNLSGTNVKVIFNGVLNGTREIEALSASDTRITVLAPLAMVETVSVKVKTDGRETSSLSYTVLPLPEPSGTEADDFSSSLDSLFTNLSSELEHAFASLPASELNKKKDAVAKLQLAISQELSAFFGSLTDAEKHAMNQILASDGFKDSIRELLAAAEILSHSDAEEALDNIAKAKAKVDSVLDILTQMRSVLKNIKTALYISAAAAAAAAVFTGGSTTTVALKLYDLADKIGTFISSVLSPIILAMKTVSAILGMAPTVAVKDSFTTYSYQGDIHINQYFGSLETNEIAPFTALMSGTAVISKIPLNLTSVADDDTISINEQLLSVKIQLSSSVIAGSAGDNATYKLYWRSALWYEIREYIRNKLSLGTKADLPSETIGFEAFVLNYYPSLRSQLPDSLEEWTSAVHDDGDRPIDIVFASWKALRTYSEVSMPSALPAQFILTDDEKRIVREAEQVVSICERASDKGLDAQLTYARSAIGYALGMHDSLSALRESMEEKYGSVTASLNKINKAVAFYKTKMHSVDSEYTRAMKLLASDLKALSEELNSYMLVLDDALDKLDQRAALLDSYSDTVLRQKLESLSIDNSTLVVFIKSPYSFKAHMDFVPPDNRNLDELLDDLWIALLDIGSDSLLDKIDFDFNTMIQNRILSILKDIIIDCVGNPLDSILDDVSNLNDVDVDIAIEVDDPTIVAVQSSAERMTIRGLKPGITTVKIYPANIKDPEVRKVCTIEKRVMVLSGDETAEPYTMGPRIDSAADKDGKPLTQFYIGDEVLFKGFGFSMSPKTYDNQTYSFSPPAGVPGTIENFMIFENSYTTVGIEIPDTLPSTAVINVGTDTKWPSNTDFTVLAPRIDNNVSTAIIGEAWPALGQGFSHTPKYNKGIFGSSSVNVIMPSVDNPTSLPGEYPSDLKVDRYNHEEFKALHKKLNLIVPNIALGDSSFKVSMYDGQLESNQKNVEIKKFKSKGDIKFSWGNDHALKPDIVINQVSGEGMLAFTRSGIDGYYPQVFVAPIALDGSIGTAVMVSDDVGGIDASPANVAISYFAGKYYVSFANRQNDIVVSSSSDGVNWSAPYVVSATPDNVDRSPDILATDVDHDGDCELALAWTEEASVETGKSIVRLAYIDAGASFRTLRITPFPSGSYGASLDTKNNILALSYSLENDSGGSDALVYYGSILDALASGSANITKLSDNGAHMTASNSSVALNFKDNSCYVVWEDTGTSGKEEVYFAKVTADGKVETSYNMSKSSRHSQTPKIDIDSEGIPVVIWFETGYPSSSRGSAGFETYLVFSRSFDEGASFNAPYMRLDTQANGARMAAPAIFAYGRAEIFIAYQFTDVVDTGFSKLTNQRGIRLVSTNRNFADKSITSSFDTENTNASKEHILRVYSDDTVSDPAEIKPGNMPDGNVYISESDGKQLMQLTRSGNIHGYVGNDGKARYIAYTSKKGVFVSEADGTNPVKIADAPEDKEIAGAVWSGGDTILYISTMFDEMMQTYMEFSSAVRSDGAYNKDLGRSLTGFSNYAQAQGDYVFSDYGIPSTPIAWESEGKPRIDNAMGIAFYRSVYDRVLCLPGDKTDSWASYSGLKLAYVSYSGEAKSILDDHPSLVYSIYGNLEYKKDPLDPWGTVYHIDSSVTMPTVGAYGKVAYIKNVGDKRKLYYIADASSPSPQSLASTSGAEELYPLFTSSENQIISHTLKSGSLRIKVVDPVSGQSWFVGAEKGFSGIASSFPSGKIVQRDVVPPVFADAKIGVTSKSGDNYNLGFSAATDALSGIYQYEITSEDGDISINTLSTNCTINAPAGKQRKISVVAIDNVGNRSLPLEFVIGANDTAAPTGTSISVKTVGGDFAIFNVAATDETQIGFYELYVDGILKQSSLAPITSMRADGLSAHSTHEAVLKVYDGRMNMSHKSVSFETKYGYTKVEFTAATGSITENSDYKAVATITMTGDAPSEAIGIDIKLEDGTAKRNYDYAASISSSEFTVYMQPGDTTVNIPVRTNNELDNAVIGDAKSFKIKITGISTGNATIGSQKECSVSINDDEVNVSSVSFEALSYNTYEISPSVTLKLIHTSGSGIYGGFSVDCIAENGTAKNGTDYTFKSGKVTFAAGESEKTITIPIIDNSIVDGDRNFRVKISSTTNGITIGTVDSAVVTIKDNDAPVIPPPNVEAIDDNTPNPKIKVTNISAGEKITLYKLNETTNEKEKKEGPLNLGETTYYYFSSISSYGSGTYYVTRTVGDSESGFSAAVALTVYTPPIVKVPVLSQTISVEKGTDTGTIKLRITGRSSSMHYYYGIDLFSERQGQVTENSAFGSEQFFAPNKISSDLIDNIPVSGKAFLNIYEVSGDGYGGTVTAVTTIRISADMIK